jgi:hypothetical protein
MAEKDAASGSSKYQDIITQKPEAIKIIRDEKVEIEKGGKTETISVMSIILDPNHFPIIKALRKGPMTVRELKLQYEKTASESDEVEEKSDKSIYRYLKVLEKADLVVPAGQRVVLGKTATETLFVRTARVFLLHGEKEEKDDSGAKRIAELLGRIQGKKPNIKCLVELMTNWKKTSQKYITQLVEGADEETLELITTGKFEKIDDLLYTIGLLSWILNTPDIHDMISKCFK